MLAISSGVARTLPWPMAVDPRSRFEVIPSGCGIVLGFAPGNGAGSLKPKRSAMSTRRFAPTLTPSGANTELHDWTNAFSSVPPHDSPFALSSGTPSISAWVATGNVSVGFATWPVSTAANVTSLNVDPGGWGPEKAMPARARTWPVCGSSAATPPSRPPSALTAAASIWRSIVVLTACAG